MGSKIVPHWLVSKTITIPYTKTLPNDIFEPDLDLAIFITITSHSISTVHSSSTQYQYTLSKHRIRQEALKKGAFSAANNAEVARGKAAGLYVTRSELTVNRVDTMSKEEVLERMKELYYQTDGILPAGKVIEGEYEESN